MGKENNKKKTRWIIIIVIVVIVFIAIMVMLQNAEKNRQPSFEINEVVISTIEVNVDGSGVIESFDNETIYNAYNSEVKEVYLENGDVVEKGEIIAVLESDSLDETILAQKAAIENLEKRILYMTVESSTYIDCKAKGRIKEVYAEKNDSIDSVMGKYGSLAVISTDDKLKSIFSVNDLSTYTLGDDVDIKIDDIVLTAQVDAINPINRTITIVFEDDHKEAFDLGKDIHLIDKLEKSIAQGSIEANHPFYVTAKGGVIRTVNYEKNDYIYEGETIFKRKTSVFDEDYLDAIDDLNAKNHDLSEMETAKTGLIVRAPMNGVVQKLDINEGQFIIPGFIVCEVQGNTLLKILVDIDELDIAKIELDQNAIIKMDALEGNEYTATVSKINPVGKSINNVTNYEVTLALEAKPEILLGMSAEIEILAQKAENVVTIPLEAVQTIGNKHYVLLESDLATTQTATHEIEIGVSDNVNAEVISGLNEGDKVATLVEYVNPRTAMMGPPSSSDE